MTKVQRYKVGYYSDEWGSSNTPCLIPNDNGYAVKFEDYCKLEAENERLKHNLTSTEQTMREYQELAAKRLEKITKYRDAPVVDVVGHSRMGLNSNLINIALRVGTQLIVKPGE